MKTILLILVIFFISCKGKKINPVITGKSYLTYTSRAMPKGICRFFVKEYERGISNEFQDSCHLYQVGDTIYSTKQLN